MTWRGISPVGTLSGFSWSFNVCWSGRRRRTTEILILLIKQAVLHTNEFTVISQYHIRILWASSFRSVRCCASIAHSWEHYRSKSVFTLYLCRMGVSSRNDPSPNNKKKYSRFWCLQFLQTRVISVALEELRDALITMPGTETSLPIWLFCEKRMNRQKTRWDSNRQISEGSTRGFSL